MFDQKQKSCVKRIHLVTDDGLYDRKAFYKVKIVFIHPSRIKCLVNKNFYFIKIFLKSYSKRAQKQH